MLGAQELVDFYQNGMLDQNLLIDLPNLRLAVSERIFLHLVEIRNYNKVLQRA